MTDLCRVFLFIYLIIVMIFFPSMIPRKTAIKPRILLASTLSSAILYSPVRISTIVSRAKEEKVVKPPKRPVNSNQNTTPTWLLLLTRPLKTYCQK